jgi:hypothetical protein
MTGSFVDPKRSDGYRRRILRHLADHSSFWQNVFVEKMWHARPPVQCIVPLRI